MPREMNEDKYHDEARRLARLLVREIKMYNESRIEEGLRDRNLYGLLKDDIDRSRKMYEERIAPSVLYTTDYFNDELIRELANGDRAAMGW